MPLEPGDLDVGGFGGVGDFPPADFFHADPERKRQLICIRHRLPALERPALGRRSIGLVGEEKPPKLTGAIG